MTVTEALTGSQGTRVPEPELTAVSLFAGVGGFDLALEDCGIRVVAQVEKDLDCLRVLETHWPDSIRIDDVKKANKNTLPSNVDIVVGGFPCTNLSVAGKRAGLKGSESGLWFEFLRILEEIRPKGVIIENVPGLLSSNGGKDFQTVLEGLARLGYSIDVEIKDSQEFGLAQRRKRVFIVCVRLDVLLQKKTALSRNISTDLIPQQLLDTWAGIPQVLYPVPYRLGYARKTEVSAASRELRTTLFEKTLENSAFPQSRNAWDALLVPFTGEGNCLESNSTGLPEPIMCVERARAISERLFAKTAAEGFTDSSTSLSLSAALEGICGRESWFTTSISSKTITEKKIFTFLTVALNTLVRTLPFLDFSQNYWSEESSISMLLKECISYADSASNQLFMEDTERGDWWDYFNAASDLADALERSIRDGSAAQILFEREGMSRNPPSRQTARQGAARHLENRSGNGRGQALGHALAQPAPQRIREGALQPEAALARGGGGGISEALPGDVAGTLQADGAGTARTGNERSEADMMIPVRTWQQQAIGEYSEDDLDSTLMHRNYKSATDTRSVAAIDLQQVTSPINRTTPQEVAPVLAPNSDTIVFEAEALDARNLNPSGDVAAALQAKSSGGHSLNYQSPVVIGIPDPAKTVTGNNGRQPDNSDSSTPGNFNHEIAGAVGVHSATGDDISPTLTSEGADAGEDGRGRHAFAVGRSVLSVRRLTPLETERLQGWPDGHTAVIGPRKQKLSEADREYLKRQYRRVYGIDLDDEQVARIAADTARYRQTGNGVSTPVVRWIVRRLLDVIAADKAKEREAALAEG